VLSGDASGELSLILEPGWYALVYGSGLFGADGFGVSPISNTDIGITSYVTGQPVIPGFWGNSSPRFTGRRFFVEGFVIPEPSTSLLMLFGVGSLLAVCRVRAAAA